jgi:hypothetical protein
VTLLMSFGSIQATPDPAGGIVQPGYGVTPCWGGTRPEAQLGSLSRARCPVLAKPDTDAPNSAEDDSRQLVPRSVGQASRYRRG